MYAQGKIATDYERRKIGAKFLTMRISSHHANAPGVSFGDLSPQEPWPVQQLYYPQKTNLWYGQMGFKSFRDRSDIQIIHDSEVLTEQFELKWLPVRIRAIL